MNCKQALDNRAIKFIIEAGNDAIPLFDILIDEDFRSMVTESEEEHFLGVRPIFIALENTNKPDPSANQIEYKLHHVSQIEMMHIKNMQRFFRRKLNEIQSNEPVSITKNNKLSI